MSKNQKIWAGVIIIVVAVVGWRAYQGRQRDLGPIKIGVLAPLTGNFAVLGERIKNGMELARVDILKAGAAGSIDIVYEDACLPKDTVSAVKKFIDFDHVRVIGGSFCLIGLVPVIPTTEQNKMIVFNTAMNPDSVLGNKYVFSTYPSIKLNSEQMADYVYKNLHARTAAIVYYNTPFGIDYNKYLQQSFERLGGKIVASEMTALDATDFRTVLSKIKSLNPDVIFPIELANPLGNLIKQARELGLAAKIVGDGESEDPNVLIAAGKAAEGFIISSSEPQAVTDQMKGFRSNYLREFGVEPDSIAANAYDGLQLQMMAYKECGVDADCMAKALHAVKNYSGVSGVITIDPDGSAYKDVIWKVVKSGKFINL